MRLVRIFDEYSDITIVGMSNHSRYDALYRVVRIPDAKVTVERVEEYVRSLQERYPYRNFMLKQVNMYDRKFYVITRKSYTKTPDGRIEVVRDRIPVYIDIENQEFYIPESYIRRNRRLANYVIMKVLGALGVARVEYVRMLGRAQTSSYKKGYHVEHFCREVLQKIFNALVVRSARSLGPADIVAILPGSREIWLVQVKQAEAPRDTEKLKKLFKDLKALEGEYTVKAKAFMKVGGRYRFIDL